jgi:hypothetical protein
MTIGCKPRPTENYDQRFENQTLNQFLIAGFPMVGKFWAKHIYDRLIVQTIAKTVLILTGSTDTTYY